MDEIRAGLVAEGLTEPTLSFTAARRMEDYQQTQPSMRERQAIVRRVYPPAAHPSAALTDTEVAWLIDHLEFGNDPVGQGIRDKLHRRKSGDRL